MDPSGSDDLIDAAIARRLGKHPPFRRQSDELELGRRYKVLLDNGWTELLPCTGKIPRVQGWRHRPAHELLAEASEHATNIGHRTGMLVGADIDLEDTDHAEAVRLLIEAGLGKGLVRIGRRGCMLLYFNAMPIEKVSVTAKAAGAPKPANWSSSWARASRSLLTASIPILTSPTVSKSAARSMFGPGSYRGSPRTPSATPPWLWRGSWLSWATPTACWPRQPRRGHPA